ncbi:MAG: hypothetical protein ACRDFB_02115 [Rhabdochlamydiaceae bacterium]
MKLFRSDCQLGNTAPANAIRTIDGGWITPLFTHDGKGHPLTIHYEAGTRVVGNHVHPGPPYLTNVQQEGGNWAYTTNNNAMGFNTTWTMPTGSITNASNGIYYNPVNFDYSGTTGGSTPYTFFQVDWGTGGSSVPGGALVDGWSYTLLYGTTYNQISIPATTSQGSTYVVAGALEPSPLSSNQYVVEIELGTNAWISATPLGYTPQLGKITNLQSFQDEYVTRSGTSSLSADTVKTPTIVADNSGTVKYDTTSVTGVSAYNGYGIYTHSKTYEVMSPSVSTKQVTDSFSYTSW